MGAIKCDPRGCGDDLCRSQGCHITKASLLERCGFCGEFFSPDVNSSHGCESESERMFEEQRIRDEYYDEQNWKERAARDGAKDDPV